MPHKIRSYYSEQIRNYIGDILKFIIDIYIYLVFIGPNRFVKRTKCLNFLIYFNANTYVLHQTKEIVLNIKMFMVLWETSFLLASPYVYKIHWLVPPHHKYTIQTHTLFIVHRKAWTLRWLDIWDKRGGHYVYSLNFILSTYCTTCTRKLAVFTKNNVRTKTRKNK